MKIVLLCIGIGAFVLIFPSATLPTLVESIKGGLIYILTPLSMVFEFTWLAISPIFGTTRYIYPLLVVFVCFNVFLLLLDFFKGSKRDIEELEDEYSTEYEDYEEYEIIPSTYSYTNPNTGKKETRRIEKTYLITGVKKHYLRNGKRGSYEIKNRKRTLVSTNVNVDKRKKGGKK